MRNIIIHEILISPEVALCWSLLSHEVKTHRSLLVAAGRAYACWSVGGSAVCSRVACTC